MTGFFVFLSPNPSHRAAKNKIDVQWTANLVEEIKFWTTTTGATPDEAMELQRAQYRNKLSTNQPVPVLMDSTDGPMASGKITRFVTV
jgi:hypothetical protein